MGEQAVLAVGGNRLRWDEVDAEVRATLERALGAAVVHADSRPGGFSPGVAAVVTLADGRTAFVKAVSRSRSEFTYGAIRAEAGILSALPAAVPAPRLRFHHDDGEWTALVTDAIDGANPAQPWRADELARFLDAATVLDRVLTPAPIDAPKVWERTEFVQWAGLAERAERFPSWIADRIPALAALDVHWPEATRGDALMHGDFRADNIVLKPGGGFVAVNWPSVMRGPGWLDLLCALPSVVMHGGGDPEVLWSGHPFGRRVDRETVNVALAGFAGFVLARSLEPGDPLLPTIRAFQRAQGEAALRWLLGRL